MVEEGVVVGEKGGYLLVEKKRAPTCSGCSQNKFCATAGSEEKVVVMVENPVGACKGDRVEFSIESTRLLRSAFWVYLLPVSMLVAGSAFGELLSSKKPDVFRPDFFPILFGALFFLISMLWLRRYNKKVESGKGGMPVITRVIQNPG
ncbi:MAG: SoxR reducing system RseC family protein [Nitrospinota bacterium]